MKPPIPCLSGGSKMAWYLGGGGYYLKYTSPELTEHFNNRLKYPIHATIYVLLTGLKCVNNFHDKTVINPNESESV